MGFSVSSRSRCRLKSVSLRTNEEFVRLLNDVTKARRLSFQRDRVFDDVQSSGLLCLDFTSTLDRKWQSFRESIWDFDHLMKRAEKCAQFSELLTGIMLHFEQKIFPVLKKFRSYFEKRYFNPILIHMGTKNMNFLKFELGHFLKVLAEFVSSELESAHKVVVSSLALFSFVYQYLIGCVDKGGSKTYSTGSFLFRLIFVGIVLFLSSYVWIKSRQASYTASRRKRKSCPLADRTSQLGDESDVPGGLYRRAVKDSRGSVTHYRYEPRFKPHREKLESGASLEFNCLSLGSYATLPEAEIVRHIAAVLYGKEEVRPVQFEDGFCLPFPSVTDGENCPLCGKEKAVWVTHKTKQLYAKLLEEKARRQLVHPAAETGSHHGHAGGASRSDPSPSAPVAPSIAIELACFTSPDVGNGILEGRATSDCHGLGQEELVAREVFPAIFSDSDFDQFISSMPQWEDNDFPGMDDLDKVEGDYSKTDRVLGFESTSVPSQSSALDIPNFASLPQLGVGDQGSEIIEPHLNSATTITFRQLESLPERVQLEQRVPCQEERPEEISGSHVELQQKLLESEERISKLEQKLRQSEVENEKWRSMFRQWGSMYCQFAKLVSASDEEESPVDIQ